MTVDLRSVHLAVDDHDAALAFYGGALGLAVGADIVRNCARVVTLCTTTRTDMDIVLSSPRPRSVDRAVDALAIGPYPGGLRALDFATLELATVFDRAVATPGVEAWQEPITRSDGSRDIVVLDPAGNVSRIVQG